jgi:alpha-galactosidase
MRTDTATAVRLTQPTDSEGFPYLEAWRATPPIRFSTDWKGENPNPRRETEVRLLWTPEMLFVRFQVRYLSLNVFLEADYNGRRDRLWERDVCEVFLQPQPDKARRYREFEISPNGMWLDLDIGPGTKRNLESGMWRRVEVDELKKRWWAQLALPMESIIEPFDPAVVWRANFYRCEGTEEPRFYSAWCPTKTPEPNFHVPEAFGRLIFAG